MSSFDDGSPIESPVSLTPVLPAESKDKKKVNADKKTKKTTLVFPADLMKRTKKYCVEKEISMTSLIISLLDDHLKNGRTK